jgi:hypothetical protein
VKMEIGEAHRAFAREAVGADDARERRRVRP